MSQFKIRLLVVFYQLVIFCKRVFNFFSRKILNSTTYAESDTEINNKLISNAADKIGVSVRQMPHEHLELKYNNSIIYSKDSDFSFESLMAYKMCGNKFLASTILSESDLPVPVFKAFSLNEYDEAMEFFIARDKPVVVKPCWGTSTGRGITVEVTTLSEFAHSFAKALLYSSWVMVEEFAEGADYRITVLDGRVLTVVNRNAANVTGDGVNTINSLISLKNCNLYDPKVATKFRTAITVDGDVVNKLKDQCLTLKSIPEKGRKVYLRQGISTSLGGEIIEFTEQCHDDYIKMAEKAADLMKTKLSGVDLIAKDIKSPYTPGNAVINEVNTTPGLYIVREFGTNGEINTKVGEEILNYAFSLNTQQ